MSGWQDTQAGRTGTAPGGDARAVVARMVRGDASSLAELYDAHGRLVYSLSCRILGDSADAEDVVQEVFAQAWRQSSRYDPARASVAGWLLMMARTRALDRLRARRARPAVLAAEPMADDRPDPDPGPESSAIASQVAERLRRALDELTGAQRRAIDLAFYGGLTHADIAERLGEPMGTIKTRIRSALLKLRAALTAE